MASPYRAATTTMHSISARTHQLVSEPFLPSPRSSSDHRHQLKVLDPDQWQHPSDPKISHHPQLAASDLEIYRQQHSDPQIHHHQVKILDPHQWQQHSVHLIQQEFHQPSFNHWKTPSDQSKSERSSSSGVERWMQLPNPSSRPPKEGAIGVAASLSQSRKISPTISNYTQRSGNHSQTQDCHQPIHHQQPNHHYGYGYGYRQHQDPISFAAATSDLGDRYASPKKDERREWSSSQTYRDSEFAQLPHQDPVSSSAASRSRGRGDASPAEDRSSDFEIQQSKMNSWRLTAMSSSDPKINHQVSSHLVSSHFQIPYEKEEAIRFESHLHQKSVRSKDQFQPDLNFSHHKNFRSTKTISHDFVFEDIHPNEHDPLQKDLQHQERAYLKLHSQQQWTSQYEGKSANHFGSFNSFRSEFSQPRSHQNRSENKEEIESVGHLSTQKINEVIMRLHYLVDEGCFDSYFGEFVELVFPIDRLVTSSNESFIHVLLMDLFVSGLQKDTQLSVLKSAPSNLLDAMNLATYFEDVVKHEDDDPLSRHEDVNLEAENVSRNCEEEIKSEDMEIEDEVDNEDVDEEGDQTMAEVVVEQLKPQFSNQLRKLGNEVMIEEVAKIIPTLNQEVAQIFSLFNDRDNPPEAAQDHRINMRLNVLAAILLSLTRPPPKPPWLSTEWSTCWKVMKIIAFIYGFQKKGLKLQRSYIKHLAGSLSTKEKDEGKKLCSTVLKRGQAQRPQKRIFSMYCTQRRMSFQYTAILEKQFVEHMGSPKQGETESVKPPHFSKQVVGEVAAKVAPNSITRSQVEISHEKSKGDGDRSPRGISPLQRRLQEVSSPPSTEEGARLENFLAVKRKIFGFDLGSRSILGRMI